MSAARTKSSAAMASVLERALAARVVAGKQPLEISVGADRARLDADRIAEIVTDVRSRGLRHNSGRELFRQILSHELHARYVDQQRVAGRPAVATESTIRRLTSFTNAVDRMWPTWSPEEFLRSLFGTQTWLVEATDGLLSSGDRASLYRAPQVAISDEPWTVDDLFCLDEVSFLLSGDVVSYGHIVVDEAQDLTPMQARALARRCPSGSFTLLGDLAQATGPWIRDDWRELTDLFTTPTTRVEELTIGYRVPRSALELATLQLPLIAPGLEGPASIRPGLRPPQVLPVTAGDVYLAALERGHELVSAGLTTGIIVADGDFAAVLQTMRDADPTVGDGQRGELASTVTVVPASLAKGLEFDAVVVVEPAKIVASAATGRRLLYIAMTRCTQELHVVHQVELPEGLDHLAPAPVRVTRVAESDPESDNRASRVDIDDTGALELLSTLSAGDQALVVQLIRRLHETSRSGTN